MDAESITLVLNAWILAFRKLFEDIGLDRVIRRRLRKALVFKYDSLNQNVAYRTKCSIKGLLEILQQPLFYAPMLSCIAFISCTTISVTVLMTSDGLRENRPTSFMDSNSFSVTSGEAIWQFDSKA